MSLVIFFLAVVMPRESAATNIKVVDQSGDPFPNVLVIIRSLDKGNEICRYLTDKDGKIPTVRFEQDLYRIIATCPYGICKTAVSELFGSTIPSDLGIEVEVKSTSIGEVLAGSPRTQLIVESVDHKRLSGLQVLVRDPEALRETWYKTDASGSVEINLPSDPSVVVIAYENALFTYCISKNCPIPFWAATVKGKCIEYNKELIHLILR
jgi:hypothetical protein